jgi:hypothetical protein
MTRIFTVAFHATRHTIRTTFTGVLAGTTLLASAACSAADRSTGPGKTNDPGTIGTNTAGLYALTTIDKKSIPFQIFRGRYYNAGNGYTYDDLSIIVTGGELVLQKNGQFHLAIDLKFAAYGDEDSGTRSFNGRYKVNGTELVLTDATGSVSGTLAQGLAWVHLDPGAIGGTQTYYFKFVP